ncbi:hypothetical protein [Sulfuritalea sp.]|uniref:hypothetical protein n=1 Tax=Sulfuritalea sp. TaxID=2480090 RepID=UPI001AD0A234|nr:hypothetical protein [Sulfuritalea sp.]MBN8474409.1 hypothetical protein [Sulfuritalea sp.]
MAAKASARKLRAAEVQAGVLQLRKAGLPFSKIGEQLGISRAHACKVAKRALVEFHVNAAADAADLLALSVARLDHLLTTLWPKATAGNLGAVDRVLAIEQRRARLLGLEAPSKIAPVDPSGGQEYKGRGLSELLALGGLGALRDAYQAEKPNDATQEKPHAAD